MIFEGDIVKYIEKPCELGDTQEITAEVFFDEESAAFVLGKNKNPWNFFSDYTIIRETLEIVGNIFENPHLLD